MRWGVSVAALVVAAAVVIGVLSGCTSGETTTQSGDEPSSAPSPILGPSSSPSAATSAPGTPVPGESSALPTEGPRVIELELTSDLRIVQRGQQITDIEVRPGETIRFVLTNTAGFDHDFYVGPDDRLAANSIQGLPGLDTWSSAEPRQFDWTVPEDVANLKFGCTLRGHYPRMSGSFSIGE